MSDPNFLYMRSLTAFEIITKLIGVAKEAFAERHVHLEVTTNVKGLRLSVDHPAQSLEQQPQVQRLLEQVKGRRHVVAVNATLWWRDNNELRYTFDTSDGVIGRLLINSNPEPSRAAVMLDAAESQFELSSYADLARSASSSVDDVAIAAREQSVADLQETLRKLTDFMSDLAIRERKARLDIQEEQERAFTARTDKLDAEYRARQEKLEQQATSEREALARREKAFEAKVAHYDLNEPKAKRRELLERIEGVLTKSETASTSKETAGKRLSVHIACGGALATSLALIVTMLVLIARATAPDWHYFAGLGSGVILFASTMIYYVKWNDRWFREHADAEFAAKRYKADIYRASWVAELVQELAKDHKEMLPPDLLAAYTRNLFRDGGQSKASDHPIDGLTGIAKRATQVEVTNKGVVFKASPSQD